jgi:serine/threonine protein kinase
VKIVGDVLQALAHAHLQGVVHCDVKPANVLLKGERALLTDFGFAKDLALTAITGDQEMLGTPNYMAPEQFRGVRTDHRSDLYGVGAVLYHALTGEPPYGSQVVRWLVGDDRVPRAPLPSSARSLAGVVDRALARDPEARFPHAEAMLAALRAASA